MSTTLTQSGISSATPMNISSHSRAARSSRSRSRCRRLLRSSAEASRPSASTALRCTLRAPAAADDARTRDPIGARRRALGPPEEQVARERRAHEGGQVERNEILGRGGGRGGRVGRRDPCRCLIWLRRVHSLEQPPHAVDHARAALSPRLAEAAVRALELHQRVGRGRRRRRLQHGQVHRQSRRVQEAVKCLAGLRVRQQNVNAGARARRVRVNGQTAITWRTGSPLASVLQPRSVRRALQRVERYPAERLVAEFPRHAGERAARCDESEPDAAVRPCGASGRCWSTRWWHPAVRIARSGAMVISLQYKSSCSAAITSVKSCVLGSTAASVQLLSVADLVPLFVLIKKFAVHHCRAMTDSFT
jgi:hypothetical protein